MAHARCVIPPHVLATDSYHGEEVIKLMIEAAVFAEIDPYRATTHNKGVMNGIDAVAIATGNDWRAIEAGAHAYVCRGGRYTSMTQWWQDEEGNLRGSIQLPMAVGIVGGATKSHPTARVAMKILAVQTARELAEVMVSVGLAQNFAAIRALATEGIQQGHMTLHARQLAMAAGATGDLINQIVDIMLREKNIRLERAKELVKEISGKQ
jgi:hydroxymethylglutaryl-CoA reductase